MSSVRSLEYVPRETFFAVHINGDILTDELLAGLRNRLSTSFPLPPLGMPAEYLEELTVAFFHGEKGPGVVVKYRLDEEGTSTFHHFAKKRGVLFSPEFEVNGTPISIQRDRSGVAVLPDETIIFADSHRSIERSLTGRPATDTKWASHWNKRQTPLFAIIDTSLLRAPGEARQLMLGAFPPTANESIDHIVSAADAISIEVALADELRCTLRAVSGSSEEATQVQSSLKSLVSTARLALASLQNHRPSTDSPTELIEFIGFLENAVEQTRVDKTQRQTAMEVVLDGTTLHKIKFGLIAPPKVIPDVRKEFRSTNRLRGAAMAVLNYESTFRHFPARVLKHKDQYKEETWNWRIALAAFDGSTMRNDYQARLRWNDPVNLALLPRIPDSLQAEGAKAGMSDIFILEGKDALFDGNNARGFGDLKDKASETIILVMLPKTVPWTKPDSLPFDENEPLPFKIPPDGLLVATADGSIHLIPPGTDPEELKKAITIAGGEESSLLNGRYRVLKGL